MDLSVIVVNYKVKDLLERCLASVFRGTRGATFEVFVVDNDSADGSAEMVREKFPQARLIANGRNAGFAAANNLAMREAKGDFIIWLNPDCELRDDALSAMVGWMRAHPQAAIVGPRLIYADGRSQPSVRRFPTLADQMLILVKVHNALPNLAPLRRYFAADFDYAAAAPVDQVMGAALLLRRSTYEKIGGMDERYFLWFEEVDYCKTAKDSGLEVWYVPVATIVHHGGQSFGQVFAPRKQRMLNESMRKYFLKHFGVPGAAPVYALHPVSMFLAWIVSLVRGAPAAAGDAERFLSAFQRAFVAYVGFELLSYAAFFHPVLATALFVTAVITVAALALKRPDLAALAVLAELFTGSQGGALLSVGNGSGLSLPLRIGVFLAFFTVWFGVTTAGMLRRGTRSAVIEPFLRLRQAKLLIPYAAMLLVIGMGAARGFWFGNGFGNVFFDGNAYVYLALLPPLVGALAKRSTRIAAAALACAAAAAMVLKALVVHYLFSHRLQRIMVPLYVWIRDTRVGEITRMVGDFYRIFFQSELFLLPIGFVAIFLYAYFAKLRGGVPQFWLAVSWIAVTGLLMSLSRSFWVGIFLAVIATAGFFLWTSADRAIWKRVAFAAASGATIAIIALAAVYAIPFPKKGADFSLADLLKRRATSLSDDAANSRWALLPKLEAAIHEHPLLGSGLGRTVTYTTSDPRLLADNPSGAYTTYAFEWGYHDLLLKFGVVGMIAFAWLLGNILGPLWNTVAANRKSFRTALPIDASAKEKTAVIAAALLAGAIAVLATNVFSPYLNHPLGIGFFILLAAFAIYDCKSEGMTDKQPS